MTKITRKTVKHDKLYVTTGLKPEGYQIHVKLKGCQFFFTVPAATQIGEDRFERLLGEIIDALGELYRPHIAREMAVHLLRRRQPKPSKRPKVQQETEETTILRAKGLTFGQIAKHHGTTANVERMRLKRANQIHRT
jgi:hypothetical protein